MDTWKSVLGSSIIHYLRDVIPANVQNISPLFFVLFCLFLLDLWRKNPIKFYDFFAYSLRTYEVLKFWLIKLYFDLNDIIHANKHTEYANCGLAVNFWIFSLMSSCFMMKKDHFKQKLFIWRQVPFKHISVSFVSVGCASSISVTTFFPCCFDHRSCKKYLHTNSMQIVFVMLQAKPCSLFFFFFFFFFVLEEGY